MFDVLILGGEVLDGDGNPAVRADVGVREGCIAEMGDLRGRAAVRVIEAEGRTVAPGFIDIHTHSDFNLPVNPAASGKTEQGVTTEVTGNCGFSPAPIVPEHESAFRESVSFVDSGLDYPWRTFAEFMDALPPMGVNMVPLVGHIALRCAAMGAEDRTPSDTELMRMQALTEDAMQAGAFGISTGLVYPPACYARTDEIAALARVAAQHGGGYYVHMRNEGDRVLEAIRENLIVAERSGAHLQISHLKVAGAGNKGRADEVLALVEDAIARGVPLHCDQYPYSAGSTGLKVLLPPWAHDGGTAATVRLLQNAERREQLRADVMENRASHFMRLEHWGEVMIAESASRPDAAGFTLAELGERDGRHPVDVAFDLLVADQCATLAVYHTMDEADVRRIMRHSHVAIGSDGIYFGRPGNLHAGRPHPRYFGTFPRVAGRYTREEGVLALPEAIRKMTGLCADILGLADRGRVREGLAADLVVFDPATLLDNATYQDPFQRASGMETVLVNGVATVLEGLSTGETGGTVLRHGRS